MTGNHVCLIVCVAVFVSALFGVNSGFDEGSKGVVLICLGNALLAVGLFLNTLKRMDKSQ